MDLKELLLDERNNYKRFDEIDKDYLDNLDISSFFKLENDINVYMSDLKDKYTSLDLIYLNYYKIKKNLNKKIIKFQAKIDKLNEYKTNYNENDIKKKLLFFSKEYIFLKETTDTKKMLKQINLINEKIELIFLNIKSKKNNYYYNVIKEKYNNIIIFIKSEKFDDNIDYIPNNLSPEQKIKWYEKNIKDLNYKKQLFNEYIINVENLYNKIIKRKISSIHT